MCFGLVGNRTKRAFTPPVSGGARKLKTRLLNKDAANNPLVLIEGGKQALEKLARSSAARRAFSAAKKMR